MTLLQALTAYAVYLVIGVIVSLAVITVWIQHTGRYPTLLDGTAFQSALDDRDRARMVAAHDRDEEQVCNAFAVQLEELRGLPETLAWRRWLP